MDVVEHLAAALDFPGELESVATCLPAGDAALRAAAAPVPDAERAAVVDTLRARVEARQATD